MKYYIKYTDYFHSSSYLIHINLPTPDKAIGSGHKSDGIILSLILARHTIKTHKKRYWNIWHGIHKFIITPIQIG